MKILIILPILFLILLNTGCILQIDQETSIITEKSYIQDDVLEKLTFNLPKSLANPIIAVTFQLPNGDTTGTYRQTFPAWSATCSVTKDILLYYPGLWHVDYQVFDGSTQVIEGDYNFWVQGTTGLDRYELETHTITGSQVYISVRNYGKAPGYVQIVLYEDDPLDIDGMTVYGKEYINTNHYLKPGYRFTQTLQITNIGHLKIILNEQTFEL